jgi:hypothetical protein
LRAELAVRVERTKTADTNLRRNSYADNDPEFDIRNRQANGQLFRVATQVVTHTFYSQLKDWCTVRYDNRPSEKARSDQFNSLKEVTPTYRRFPWRIATLSGTFVMVIVIGTGSTGLAVFSSYMARQDEQAASVNDPDEGIVIRIEVIRLYLPRTLIELAQSQRLQPSLHSHADLRRKLDFEHHRDLWFALTERGHTLKGGIVDIRRFRTPYKDIDHFPEFLEILAAAAGNPSADLSSAEVRLIPDGLSERDPRKVISALLDQHECAAVAERHRR